MNKDQGGGIIERMVYGAITFLVLRYGSTLGLTADDAAWLGGGAIALGGGAWAWWHNRPVSILNRASEALPDNTKLIMRTAINATSAEKAEVFALGENTHPRVSAQAST